MTNTTKENNIIGFKANLILKGKIKCLTGLHIGGSKDKLEIGGVDSPVLRNPHTRHPYIPGSSIKGKLRYLLEYSTGAVTKPINNRLGDVSMANEIVRIFGIGANEKEDIKDLETVGPTRLIVRDCNPDQSTIDMWENVDSELLYTEYKPENTIDRLTSAANPRFIERVVAGSFFDFEMVYSVYYTTDNAGEERANTEKDLKNLLQAIRLLENSALGKAGSRGYGQIKLYLQKPIWVTAQDYQDNTPNYQEASKKVPDTTKEMLGIAEVKVNLPTSL